MKNNKTSKKIRRKVNKSLPNKQKEGSGTVKSLMLSLCVYALCTVAVSLALSVLLVTLPDPVFLLFPCSMLSAAFGAIVSGIVFRKMSNLPSVLSGIVTAVSAAVLTLALSFVPALERYGSPSFGKAVLMGVLMLSSMLGAYIGGKKTSKPRHSMR